jgi:hypothetical protein
MRIELTDKAKAILWWIALAASMLFLVIGVDYFPPLVCWTPMCIVFCFAMQSKSFKKSFDKFTDRIC